MLGYCSEVLNPQGVCGCRNQARSVQRPQGTWRVAWGPLRELRGCRGLSPDSGTSGTSRPTSPLIPQLRVGSRKQPKLGEARTHSSPKCPCLSTWNCSPSSSGRSPESHPRLFSPLHIHIPSFSKPRQLLLQNISRTLLCPLVPGPSLGLSTDISHLESRGSLSAVFLLPVPRTKPEGPCGHLRWVTSLPAQGPPVDPSHSGERASCHHGPRGPT